MRNSATPGRAARAASSARPTGRRHQAPRMPQHPPTHGGAPSPGRAVAAAAEVVTSSLDCEFLGVLAGMQTVRGVMEVSAPAELVYSVLSDFDAGADVFGNIVTTQTLVQEDGSKHVLQACRWQFLAFSGTFDVQLAVQEDAAAGQLVFRLVESSFMRDFEGRWQVTPLPEGCRIEHVLAIKPGMPIPEYVAELTKSIFVQQTAGVLEDLAQELARRQQPQQQHAEPALVEQAAAM